MATLAFTDAVVTIDSVDLSAFANSVTFSYQGEVLDETAFGDDTRIHKGGLLDWSVEINFNQDYGASATDISLFAKINTVVAVSVKPTSGSTAVTNPDYNGNGLLTNYQIMGNSVGDLASATLSIVSAGTLARDTT